MAQLKSGSTVGGEAIVTTSDSRLHTHPNSAVLGALSNINGSLAYNGTVVGGGSSTGNIDGGKPNSVYTPSMIIDGGGV